MPLDLEQIHRKLEGYPEEVVCALDRFAREGDLLAFESGLLGALGFLSDKADAGIVATAADNVRLREDLAVDSLAVTELVFLIEDTFGTAVEDHEIENLETVGDFRKLARETVAARLH